MPDIKQQLEDYLKATEEIQEKIKEFKEAPKPILISHSVILKALSVAMLGVSALLAPKMAIVAGAIKLGGKVLSVLSERKE
jgi:hypothetical protein